MRKLLVVGMIKGKFALPKLLIIRRLTNKRKASACRRYLPLALILRQTITTVTRSEKIRAKAAATKKKRPKRRKERNRRFNHLYDSIKNNLYVEILLSWDGIVEDYLRKAELCTELEEWKEENLRGARSSRFGRPRDRGQKADLVKKNSWPIISPP